MKTLTFIATCFILALATQNSFAQIVPPSGPPSEGVVIDIDFKGKLNFTCTSMNLELISFTGNIFVFRDACGNKFVLTASQTLAGVEEALCSHKEPDCFGPGCSFTIVMSTNNANGVNDFKIEMNCN